MKKPVLYTLGFIILILAILFIAAFILSFKVVKKNTDKINASLKQEFSKIVLIPDVVGPNFKSFEKVSYRWDMVTKENEVTSVQFTHDTDIPLGQNKIIATLEMPQGSDPSVFFKVLPAVISDQQTLSSLETPEHKNLGSSEMTGYNKIEMYQSEEKPDKVVKIVWEFNKEDLTKNSKTYYDKLYQYPQPVLKALYNLQQSVLLFLKP